MGLDDLLANVNKTYGKGTLMRASEASALNMERIALGIPYLDLALGGGIPRSRIIKLQGAFSTGKTLLALRAASKFQQHCRYCSKKIVNVDMFTGEVLSGGCKCKEPKPMQVVWLDAEGAWSNGWAERQGVSLENIYVIQPTYAEQGIDVADEVLRSRECDLLVVDSLAAMTPSKEIEASTEDWQMGLHARLVNKAMRKFTASMNTGGLDTTLGKTTVILINQIRVKLGIVYGNSETTPGGIGQDHHASVILRVASRGLIKKKIDKEEVVIGKKMGFDVPKNRTYDPHKSGIYEFYFKDIEGSRISRGMIDIASQWLSLGLETGFVEKKGAWFYIEEDEEKKALGHGADNAADSILGKPDLCREIWEAAKVEEWGSQ